MKGIGILLCFLAYHALPVNAQHLVFQDSAALFMPGIVSSSNADVKITFSPDGTKMLWGGIDYIKGKKDMDIWISEKVQGKWSKPERAAFDSDSNDFDPSFSPDGSGVYFFSNRNGGFGGDDIYFVPYHTKTNKFGEAINAGNTINTSGDEWTPVTDPQGKYLYFSSNGRGGHGGQDLFKAKIIPHGFGKPVNLGDKINGRDDDFDLVVLHNGGLIFTSAKGKDKKADLYFSAKQKGGYSQPYKLPALINAAGFWTFGPSVNPLEPGYLYFSSHLAESAGRTDIYKIKYSVPEM